MNVCAQIGIDVITGRRGWVIAGYVVVKRVGGHERPRASTPKDNNNQDMGISTESIEE